MSAEATHIESKPANPELDRLRGELAQVHNPVNAHEQMLVTQIAQSWLRLERAHEWETAYFNGRNKAETLATKLKDFKAITRFVTDCERAWRHAVVMLERTQRRREREARPLPNARQASQRPATPPPPATPAPLAGADTLTAACARRE